MKIRIIFALLFFIATTFGAIHEIEHIKGDHDHTTCQICTLTKNILSHDAIDFGLNDEAFCNIVVKGFDAIKPPHAETFGYNSRAPPSYALI